MKYIQIIAIISLLFLTSCSREDECMQTYIQRDGIFELDSKEALWRDSGIRDYILEYDKQCYCIDAVPTRVTVVDNQIIKVEIMSWGEESYQEVEEAQYSEYLTIDDFFNKIKELNKSVDILNVEYDPTLGYPNKIEIDRHTMRCYCNGVCTDAIDDELNYTLKVSY